jgi:DNA polymerase III delta subunit
VAQKRDFAAVIRELETGQPRPFYVIVGEDQGLRAEAIAAVRRAVFGKEPPGQALVAFGPPDPAVPSSVPKLATVLDEARTPSLFTARKLVLVRGADALLSPPARGAGAASKSEGAAGAAGRALIDYLESPTPGTVLVLEAEKLDGRSALAKALESAGALVSCPKLYASFYGQSEVSVNSEMGRHLMGLARVRSLRLANDAAERLLELSGGETARLSAELEKLDGYLGSKRRDVSLADVEALSAGATGELDDAVLNVLAGKTAETLRAIEELLSRGMEDYSGRLVWDEAAIALILVSALGRRAFDVERTALAGGHYTAKSGKPPPPHVGRAIETAAARWRGPVMERAYRRILEAELELKGYSGRSAREVLQDLVLDLGKLGQEKPLRSQAAAGAARKG